ncbi:bifunctional diaminohydroxyphosphoribosylaminopyrimidine deaminase/5-amino-6-(5-phosphoribosylamino)uracil reductase RibD [Sphingomicrobium marinum]|uniref:bifunctional diaminohydroxyphosphoribosylaminopyrimidine deaminase/5-amino-6-(5-phosphoribosylamino)uracil reductase RibD n=1 Tax=Sphingomicrobium marinum TaxID=1227950 RepID=UPI002240D6D4|nr:bifunctional diaminohydroxyphosphoribosylaminopyrimidine deaminase/5-amino-6-(5-phosphoribosylamino)uracil reductase RibD [Sphingomicrobium marinum]
MARAIALGAAARGSTAPNPNVGCVIVNNGEIVGEGATQSGGRPHAEAVALAAAGDAAKGATLYTSLEPCAHDSDRGPTCAKLIPAAGISRVAAALEDPDPRTAGKGLALLRDAGVETATGVEEAAARRSMRGFLTRIELGRPCITLKLALSIDGKIALPSGESKWITGEDARAHVHLERARSDMILVGRGTYEADQPSLDVRLPGLEPQSPRRAMLSTTLAPNDWTILRRPEDVFDLGDVNDLLVEGGSGAATAFLKADLVDRMLIYRAPILIGEGKSSVGYIGLDAIADAHGRWLPADEKQLGIDRLEVYERQR